MLEQTRHGVGGWGFAATLSSTIMPQCGTNRGPTNPRVKRESASRDTKMEGSTMDTMGDVERLNASTGHHWFDADSLRFFESRIDYGYGLMYGRFFISTEKRDDDPRRASIRAALDSGGIETVGEFQQFASPAAAVKALEKGRAAGVNVRHDPYDDLPGFSEEGFHWRTYVGDLPVGSRTTWRDAYSVAEELGYSGDQFEYEPWRHGGWYVYPTRWPNGGCGCVSRHTLNPRTGKPDRHWRIVCDRREGDHTYCTRTEAARAERDLIAAGAFGAAV